MNISEKNEAEYEISEQFCFMKIVSKAKKKQLMESKILVLTLQSECLLNFMNKTLGIFGFTV